MTTTIPTGEVIDMINDIAAALDLDIAADTALRNWVISHRFDMNLIDPDDTPSDIYNWHASQAIADIVAYRISQADEELVDAAMQDMETDEGWQFKAHNVVLWVESRNTNLDDTLVVWLGNERDYDMASIGRSKINY
jgi:hypothetical protein